MKDLGSCISSSKYEFRVFIKQPKVFIATSQASLSSSLMRGMLLVHVA